MGRRSRKRRPGDTAPGGGPGPTAPAPTAPAPTTSSPARSRARSRSEQRNAEARAALIPLRPGERPGAVTIAALVAAALAISNLVLYAVGTKIHGKSPSAGALLFTVVLGAAAIGLWRARYWAVLGFEALLALIVLYFSLLLLRAGNIEAVVLAVAVIGLGGWLFWKLVRAMARIQMPRRVPPAPGSDAR